MSPNEQHVIIGAGHNGLVCATLLARAGRKVLVLEAANEVGGMAQTREFAPGFKVSACAHLAFGLQKDLAARLGLSEHGLAFSAQNLPTTALNPNGAPVVFEAGSVRGVSAADAQTYTGFAAQLERFSHVLAQVFSMEPFKLALATWPERLAALRLAWKIRVMGKRDMREFLRVIGMNAYDLLTDHFESTSMKGALAFDATLGGEHGARSPGTVLTLLYRRAGLQGAGPLGIAQPKGGMGALTQSLAAAARAAGVEIRCGQRVARILVEEDKAAGVVLESGEKIPAGSVISNADPKTTFLKLLGAEHLDTDFVRRIDHFRSKGLVAKLHLALDGLPEFTGVEPASLSGRLLVSPSLDYLELAFNPSKYRQIPDEPVLEITIPTIKDPSLAQPGKHVLSINVMFVPYDLGPDPSGTRARLLRNILAVLERFAPAISEQIIASELLTPLDIEREFGVAGGHWHHGALAFDQFFFTRPVPGAAGYTTPVPGLFLCGAGSHPGGGVMGLAGQNAAQKILAKGH
jgi:phytoene dehydrogenase-like protein